MDRSDKCHWLAAKRILRYLTGTTHLASVYTKTNEPQIGYTDADWGDYNMVYGSPPVYALGWLHINHLVGGRLPLGIHKSTTWYS